MKKTTTLALAAGLACASTSIAQVQRAPEPLVREAKPTQLAGYVYINAATGERVYTSFNTTDASNPLFINNDSSGNGNFFTGLSVGIDPGDPSLTEEALDWGEVDAPLSVDCFVYAYATNVPPDTFIGDPGDFCPNATAPTATGFNSFNMFYNNSPGFGVQGTAASNSDGTQGFLISNLPGGGTDGSQFCGWIITIDLAGIPLTFALGDQDVDGDGGLDIGWSYTFQDPTGAGTTGPFLVLPPGAFSACPNGVPNDLGIDDAFDTFEFTTGTNTGTWFFGGYICETIPDATFPPFASFWMELFGEEGGGPPVCFADCNEDGQLGILDFICFQQQFGAGNLDKADCDGNGQLGILDFICFQQQFGEGCP